MIDATPHECILAAAGTGKTFRLSSRYLHLLRAGAEPEAILATTFTRAAAGEIAERVIERLLAAVENDEKRAELAQSAGGGSLTRDEALDLLMRLVGRLHRQQVRTIDSFFASVVRGFSLDLGIGPDTVLVDEVEGKFLSEEAIASVLHGRGGVNPASLLADLEPESRGVSVCGSLDAIVSELYSVWREAPDAWDGFPVPEPAADPAALIGAVEATTAGAKPSVLKAVTKTIGFAHAGDWKRVLGETIVRNVWNGNAKLGSTLLPDDLAAALDALAGHARAAFGTQHRAKTLATCKFLAAYDKSLRRIKERERAFSFEDLTLFLHEASRLGVFEDIAYRLDGRIDHVEFDEFQDTSLLQWTSLAPLVDEILQSTDWRTFFCVGDVKQSIYAWRDACPEILESVPELRAAPDGKPIGHEPLAMSYRSSPAITDFVNAVFEPIAGNEVVGKASAKAGEEWARGFETHTTVHKNRLGYVCVRALPLTEDDEQRYAVIAQEIAELHRQHPERTIGVLVRTNKAATGILNELGPGRLDLDVSGRGGHTLDDAASVNAVLDLLRLADHSGDTAAAFHIAGTPLGRALGFADWNDKRARMTFAHEVRREIVERGCAATMARWVALIAADVDEREHHRLHQLVDIAGEYESPHLGRLDDLRSRLVSRMVAEASPARIQVMTVHAAKGLEFDAVVLPQLDVNMTGTRKLAVEREDGAGAVTRVTRWMGDKERAYFPELEEVHASVKTREVRESLCGLYVAITRAKFALHVLLKPDKPDAKSLWMKLDGVLRHPIDDTVPLLPETILYEEGDPDWAEKVKLEERASDEHAPPPELRLRKAAGPRPGRAAKPPSAIHHARFFGGADARDLGSAVHLLFEEIEWIETFEASGDHLDGLLASAFPRRDAAWRSGAIDLFRNSLASDAVAALLARPGDEATVHHELPFARRIEGGLQRGAIDRLVVRGGAVPSSVEVIDFKTDAVKAGELADAVDGHRAQLEVYREVAAAMYGVALENVAAKLVFVRTGEVADL